MINWVKVGQNKMDTRMSGELHLVGAAIGPTVVLRYEIRDGYSIATVPFANPQDAQAWLAANQVP